MTQVVENRWKQAVDSTVNKMTCSTVGTRDSQVDHMEKMLQEVLAATKEQIMMSTMAKKDRETQMWLKHKAQGKALEELAENIREKIGELEALFVNI